MATPSNWTSLVESLGIRAENAIDSVRSLLRQKLHPEVQLHIIAYRGYGKRTANGWQGSLSGRVLRYKDRPEPGPTELWNNLRASYARFDTDEVPGVRVQGQVNATQAEAISDEEGYFTLEFQVPTNKNFGLSENSLSSQGVSAVASISNASASSGRADVTEAQYQVEGSRQSHGTQDALHVQIRLPDYENLMLDGDPFINLPSEQARFGVISDVDDTLLVTRATSLRHMLRLTLLESATTRLAFDGVAEFYQALHDGSNPFFYVSSSPWNLYEFLTDFMRLNHIVAGPLLLRDFGIDQNKFIASEHKEHKLQQIRAVLNQYPELSFILLGDSGQKDPEIYSTICIEFPGRIKAIYIRDVSDQWRRSSVQALIKTLEQQGINMLLIPDTAAAAAHAAARGFIAKSAMTNIHHAVQEAHSAIAPTEVP